MMQNSLAEIGVRPGLIRSETFSAAGTALSASVQTSTVTFTRSGITAEWHADDGTTLLDLAEAAGLEPPFACRSGMCQSCSCRLAKGSVDYSPVPVTSPEPGTVLICCVRPGSKSVRLDL